MLTMRPNQIDPFIPLQDALAGRYCLERELGRGRMGIVYLAEEIALERMVALKLLPPTHAAEPRRRERFLREARTAARLSHPGIVPIHTVDEVDDFVFFTMAYVEGQTLARRVRARGPLPVEEVTTVLRDVAWAVAYAHAQGVIHRDLKAENILLEHGTDRALVMDFGIAQVDGAPDFTEPGTVTGTLQYMSPEHAGGRPVDERSDVYALGIVGYFAASGTLPFQGTTVSEILEHQVHTPAPPLVTAAGEHDTLLAAVVERCLAKAPDHRFQTAADLADALRDPGQVPVPLRVFVHRLRLSLYSSTALGVLAVLALLQLVNAIVLGQWGTAAVAGGVIAMLLVATMAFLLPVTRRVLRAGYDRIDIVLALTEDLDRQREELAFQFGDNAGRTERIARAAGYLGLGLFGLGAAAGLSGTLGLDIAVGSMAMGAVTAAIAGFVAARRFERRSDQPAKHWLRFWKSRLGAWTVKLAAFGLKRLPAGDARSIESAIASADRLYENLPETARKAFADLPERLRHLEVETLDTQEFIAALDASLLNDDGGAGAGARPSA